MNNGVINFATPNARISQPETVLPIVGSGSLNNITVGNNQFTYSVSEPVLLNLCITMGVINDNTTAMIELRDITAGTTVQKFDFGVMGGSLINTPFFFFNFTSIAGHAYSIRMKSYGGSTTQLTVAQATMYSQNLGEPAGEVDTATLPLIITSNNLALGTAVGPTTADGTSSVTWSPSGSGSKASVLQSKAAQSVNVFEIRTSTGAQQYAHTADGAAKWYGIPTVSAPATSGANNGTIYYDDTLQQFMASSNNGAYAPLGGSGGFPVSSSAAGTPIILTSASATITGAGNTVAGGSGTLAATLTSGTNNVLIGSSVDVGAATVASAVAIGSSAVTPSGGVVIGSGAGKAGGTASHFTAVGNAAGAAIATGADNSFFGYHAGNATSTNGNNTFLGSQAGAVNTAAANTFVGAFAGLSSIAAVRCTYLGYQAGNVAAASTDNDNTFVGYQAGLLANGSASGTNTLIGSQSGIAIVTAIKNTFVGATTGTLTTGSQNTLIGNNAAATLTTGSTNVVIGDAANVGVNSDANVVNIGQAAAGCGTGGICIGQGSGKSAASGSSNTVVGTGAAAALTSGSTNVIIGNSAAISLQSGGDNTLIGYNVSNQTTTSQCTMLGSSAGANCTGAANTLIGYHAGSSNPTSGTNNTVIGATAAVGATSAANCVSIGYGAVAPTGGTVIGNAAGKASATAAHFTSIGNSSGAAITSGADNTFVGDSAGKAATTGQQNTCIGSSAGVALVATGDDNNTFVGYKSGSAATGSSIGQNSCLGGFSGSAITTGSRNICIGYGSGSGVVTTGTNNILLGYLSDTNASGTTNAIVIGTASGANKASASSIIINTNTAINSATTNDFIIESGDTGFRRNAAGIVGPTNGAGGTGYTYAPASVITAGTMTQTKIALTTQCIHHFSWTNAMIVALGASLTGTITVGTLPAKFVVTNVFMVVTTAAAGTTSLTMSIGRVSAAYTDYITASNIQAAANTIYGNVGGADRGTNNVGYDFPSNTGTTAVVAALTSTVSNLSSVTTSTGEIYIEGYILP